MLPGLGAAGRLQVLGRRRFRPISQLEGTTVRQHLGSG